MSSLDCEIPARRRRCVMIGVFAVLLLVVVVVCLVVTLGTSSSDSCPPGVHCDWKKVPTTEFLNDRRCKDLCTSTACIRAVEYTLKRLDPGRDPCQDFYQFACGKYEKTVRFGHEHLWDNGDSTQKEIERELIGDLQDVLDSFLGETKKGPTVRYAKSFYDHCLHKNDADGVAYLDSLFAPQGKLPWPRVGDFSYADPDLGSMLATLTLFGVKPLFETNVKYVDRKWIIRMEAPNMYPVSSVYGDGNETDAYKSMISQLLVEMEVDSDDVESVVEGVVEFEKKIYDASMRSQKSESQERKYTCRELEIRYGEVTWCDFVKEMLSQFGASPSAKTTLVISDYSYFHALNRILEPDRITRRQTLVDYLNVKFLFSVQPFLPDHFEFYPRGMEAAMLPWVPFDATATTLTQRCVVLTTQHFWFALHDPYVQMKLDAPKRKRLMDMIEAMKRASESLIDGARWMGNYRGVLKSRLKHLRPRLTLDEFVPSASQLDEVFAKMPSGNRSLVADALDLAKLLTKARVTANFTLHSTWEIASMYSYFGSTTLLYSVLYWRFPLLELDRPPYLDYSTLGLMAIHPFLRDFPIHLVESKSDKAGAKEMRRKMECVREHFSTFDVYGAATGERNSTRLDSIYVHEVVALEAAMKAYRTNTENKAVLGLPGLPLTDEQLFFIAYAQLNCEHRTPEGYERYDGSNDAPPRTRVNGAVGQTAEFSGAFRCPSGSPMNPEEKCCLVETPDRCKA